MRQVDVRESDDHRDPIGHPRAGSPLVDRSLVGLSHCDKQRMHAW